MINRRNEKMRESSPKKPCQRVTIFLNRQQVDFLDKIGKDALFSSGTKFSRVKIISCLVDLLLEFDISGKWIYSTEELMERIKEKISASWPSTKDILISNEKKEKTDKEPKDG